jgi:hypothetical protein
MARTQLLLLVLAALLVSRAASQPCAKLRLQWMYTLQVSQLLFS